MMENVPPTIQTVPINLNNLNVPYVYTNGIVVGMSATEIQLTITMNARPMNTVVMSPIVARQLVESLKLALEDYEKKSNTRIPVMGDLVNLFGKK